MCSHTEQLDNNDVRQPVISNFVHTQSSTVVFIENITHPELIPGLKNSSQVTVHRSDDGVVCHPVVPLVRFKHVGDFSDTFIVHEGSHYTRVIKITDTLVSPFVFELLSFVDIGGTLKFQLSFDDENIVVNANTNICRLIAHFTEYFELVTTMILLQNSSSLFKI